MKKLIVLSKSHFPSKDASAIRFENLFPLFFEMGYKDIFVFENGYNKYLKEIDHTFYHSISIRKQPFKRIKLLSKIISRIGYERRYIKLLKQRISGDDLVLLGGNFSLNSIRKINDIAKKEGAKVILSMTERYSPSEYAFNGIFSYEYRINKRIYDKYKKEDPDVLCISSYMSSYFAKKNVKTCVIPFVFDSYSFRKLYGNIEYIKPAKTSFIYCGKPTKKDLLKEMIEAFLLLDDKLLNEIELNIIGIDSKWINKQFTKKDIVKLSSFINVLGNRDREYVASIYNRSCFSILLRPFKEDYSKAGFPTKITESLFFSVPPITNLTSDLSIYLKDSFNSIIVNGETKNEFCDAIKKAIVVSNNDEEYKIMRTNALITANSKLDTFCFKKELMKII